VKILRGKSFGGLQSHTAAIAATVAAAPAPALAAATAVDAKVIRNNIQLVHTLTRKESYLLDRIDVAPSPVVTPCSLDCHSKIRGDEGYHLFIDTNFTSKGSPKKRPG
jgi:hypothetical protein